MFEQLKTDRAVIGSGADTLMRLDASKPGDALAPFAEQAQFVYIDPPFSTGEKFSLKRPLGAAGWGKGKPFMLLEGFADQYGREEYEALLRALIGNARGLLRREGLFALHLDWRFAARARLMCEELFGEEQFVNEIVWTYESGGRAHRWFSRKHDTILLFARDAEAYRFRLENVPIPRDGKRRNHMKRGVDESGRAYSSIRVGGKEYRYYDDEPTYPSDVWTDISHLQQRDPERTGWPTQKPLPLLRRLMLPTCEPGDLAADLCCGCGTTAAAARSLGCRFLACDIAPEAVAVSAHRLGGGFTLCCGPSEADARLYGECQGGMLLLTGFDRPGLALPQACSGLDLMESWACGRVDGNGVFRADTLMRRTKVHPDLPQMAPLPLGEGEPAVVCFDAAGQFHAFRWSE